MSSAKTRKRRNIQVPTGNGPSSTADAGNRRRSGVAADPRVGRSGPESPALARFRPIPARVWPVFAVLILVTFLVFLPNLKHDFVDWDDRDNFLLNENYRGLGWTQLKWMWTTFHMGHYIPLSWMTLGLDYRLWGMDARGYHLTNNLLHAVNSGLFFLLVLRLLAAVTPSVRWHGRGLERPCCLGKHGRPKPRPCHPPPERRARWSLYLAAALGAGLFAIHPLRVESVSWVVERRDLLNGFFVLLTIIAYLRYAASDERRWWRWYALTWLLFVAACLGKVIAVTIPVILLVLDWHPLRRLRLWHRRLGGGDTGGTPVPQPHAIRLVLEKAPFFLGALGFGLVAAIGNAKNNWLYTLEAHPLTHRLVQSFYGLVFYWWKTVLPLNLSPIYELPLPFNVFEPRFVISVILACLAVVIIAVFRRRLRGVVAAGIIYAVVLAPVLGLVQNGSQIVADRYSYLSFLGWTVLLAWAVHRLLDSERTRRWAVPAIGATALAVLPGLGYLTWKQCQVWRNTASLWTHAAAITPDSSIAQNGYGWVLLQAERYDDALAHLRRAVELQPANEKAHHNIWIALRRQGRADALLQAYRDSIRVFPNFADAHYNLGVELQRRGQAEDAIAAYRAALDIKPRRSEALTNLGRLLQQKGEIEEARRHYERAIEADGANLIARRSFARLLWSQNRPAEAIAQLEAALRVTPNDETTRKLLEQWQSAPR